MAADSGTIVTEVPKYKLQRVSHVHKKTEFPLDQLLEQRDHVVVGGDKLPVDYFFAFVPLDCIDDIHEAERYNPRHPKEKHRDELMDQIGTYGLIQPLVCALQPIKENEDESQEKDEKTAKADAKAGKQTKSKSPEQGVVPRGTLFLIDGRHRYHALLELDRKLRDDVMRQAKALEKSKAHQSLSDISSLGKPTERSKQIIQNFTPPYEENNAELAPLVPVKVYKTERNVERIGMAVFLNRGQKRLAGGEYIDKLYEAYLAALDEEKEIKTPSEKGVIARVRNAQGTKDEGVIILSQHVAIKMRDVESPWFPLIGRWQSEAIEEEDEEGGKRLKPLTANNFLTFIRQMVDDTALPIINQKQRDLELSNIDTLGNKFGKIFGWPDDIPSERNKYTPTLLLCRSFLIHAVGAVLNQRHAPLGVNNQPGRLLSNSLEPEKWEAITNTLQGLHKQLTSQARIRRRFETTKRRLKPHTPSGQARVELLKEIDDLRGQLWSLDTIVPSLVARLQSLLGAVP